MANKPFPFTVCAECCTGGGGGGITTETDPTVPNWAKAPTKPTYTAEEVGAVPNTIYTLDEFNNLITDGIYKVNYNGTYCMGAIYKTAYNEYIYHQLWYPLNNEIITRCEHPETGLIFDYMNLFNANEALKDFEGNVIHNTYATKEELPKWKTLIDTTLTEEQGGVTSIKLEITEDISQMQEFNFYIEFPITAENENTSLYVSAYINSTLSGNNSFFHTYTSTKGVSGKTYCAMSNSKVINISGRKEILTFHSMIGDKTVVGNGTRGYAVSAHAPWVIPQDTPLYLTVNTSTTTFLSGTKIFLEGR